MRGEQEAMGSRVEVMGGSGGVGTKGTAREAEDEPSEGAKPKALRDPSKPSKQDVEAHNLTHIPYRRWCNICVEARGRALQHRQIPEQEPTGLAPRIRMDYGHTAGTAEEGGAEAITMRVLRETAFDTIWGGTM